MRAEKAGIYQIIEAKPQVHSTNFGQRSRFTFFTFSKQLGILINIGVTQLENVSFSVVKSKNKVHDWLKGEQEGWTNNR